MMVLCSSLGRLTEDEQNSFICSNSSIGLSIHLNSGKTSLENGSYLLRLVLSCFHDDIWSASETRKEKSSAD